MAAETFIYDEASAQPCGCDKGANYVCEWHRANTCGPVADVSPSPTQYEMQAAHEKRLQNQREAKIKASFEKLEQPKTAVDVIGHGIGLPGDLYAKSPSEYGTYGSLKQPKNPIDERTWRKQRPLYSGVLMYFPDALLEVAYCSFKGNEQHNPGEPLHWAKEKSTDEPDAMLRHSLDAGKLDTDGVRHSAKVAWRALANLQREIERERGKHENRS
jgi:hypothetical protein